MNASAWVTFLIILGIVGLSVINAFQDVTTTNEHDYYLLKETTEAAMMDSIDLTYYRMNGDFKIIKEEFVENFVRRFAQSQSLNREYKVEIYDIIEIPPKVSIRVSVRRNLQLYNVEPIDFDIVNNLDVILETHAIED